MRKVISYSVLFCASIFDTSHAETKDQFDLICKGTQRDIKNNEEPWEVHLSVDLTSSQYCFVGCKEAAVIARVEPSRIVFKNDPPGPAFDKNDLSVSRIDGSIRGLMASRRGGFVDVFTGTCIVGAFTPLPTTKF